MCQGHASGYFDKTSQSKGQIKMPSREGEFFHFTWTTSVATRQLTLFFTLFCLLLFNLSITQVFRLIYAHDSIILRNRMTIFAYQMNILIFMLARKPVNWYLHHLWENSCKRLDESEHQIVERWALSHLVFHVWFLVKFRFGSRMNIELFLIL